MKNGRIKLETADRELYALLYMWLTDEGYDCMAKDKHDLRIVDLETESYDGKTGTLYIASGTDAVSEGIENVICRPFSRLGFLDAVRTHLQSKKSPLRLDAERHRVYHRKSHVTLTEKEFAIFRILYDNADSTVSRDDIAAVARSGDQQTNAADVYICMIRRKLTELLGENPIKTVRGRGYMLTISR